MYAYAGIDIVLFEQAVIVSNNFEPELWAITDVCKCEKNRRCVHRADRHTKPTRPTIAADT